MEISAEQLKKWRGWLEPFQVSSDWNNDGVIRVCDEIDAALRTKENAPVLSDDGAAATTG